MSDPIKFYSTGDEYGEFSNFAGYPIRIGKATWPTTEHYFQAMKFKSKADQDEIRKANSPMLAAKMGRDRKRTLRKDWESAKVNVMREALTAKFTQHEDLRKLLLGTGDAKIIEHTTNDDYWGDGGDGRGKNMLGRLLVELRDRLREECDTPTFDRDESQ
ncbi:NADAR family protein [Aporhodopirellula aestuarii]|uniref:NADAR family protein n=1 Tax=Aporhodopirellula aestuarii TaxID=2950107 RepID=A0ABT0U1C5_9BACT|nr:NADAR family protein [Aporhodopirellula aestuarii]MCM2370700.1 NADAR family protein [Aporhodopirellula aestuarii]